MATRKVKEEVEMEQPKRRGRPPGTGKKKPAAMRAARKPVAEEIQVTTDTEVTEEVEQPTQLEDIGILDMRGMPLGIKAMFFQSLEEAGYVWKHNLEGVLQRPEHLHSVALNFNHVNKMVSSASLAEIDAGSAVSHVAIDIKMNFDFTKPTSLKPNVIQHNGAIYARIG